MFQLGLGTAQFGSAYGVSNLQGQPSDADVRLIISSALDGGIRVFDTAPDYGESESLIGRYVPPGAAIQCVSKVPAISAKRIGRPECDSVVASVHRSLERLRRDSLDVLLVHRASDLALPGAEMLVDTLRGLARSGLVKALGVSVYDPTEVELALDSLPLGVVQLPLNVFDQRFLRSGMLARLAERGIAVHARSVFLQGILLMEPEDLPQGPRRVAAGPLGAYHAARAEAGLSALQAALGFVRSVDHVDVGFVGANSAAELVQCVEAASTPPAALDWPGFASEDPALIDPRTWPGGDRAPTARRAVSRPGES